MKNEKSPLAVLGHAIVGLIIIAAIVGIVMWLWNLLMPSITGWSTINYWQALGLMVLMKILCGSAPHSYRHHHHQRRHWRHLHQACKSDTQQ